MTKKAGDNNGPTQSYPTGSPFELKPIDFRKHSNICVSFRTDSFICSFGNAQAFLGPDNTGADRYMRWLQGKSNELAGSCAHLWHGARIIGQMELGLIHDFSPSGYIYLIYLIREYRQRGLGTKLLQHAESLFEKWGTARARLRVSPTNIPAIAMYKKNGWSQTGTEPDADHLLTLEKEL